MPLFKFSSEILKLAEKPSSFSGDAFHTMFCKEMMGWDFSEGSKFSTYCYDGNLLGVQKLVEANPNLLGPELDLSFGPLTQVILGSRVDEKPLDVQREGLLQYLCDLGCPVDKTDIFGVSALWFAFVGDPKLEFAKILLKNGANINLQNRSGSTVLMQSIKAENVESTQFLLENGADIDLGDVKGVSAESIYRRHSPKVVAVVERWKRKRLGLAAPLQDKMCAMCKQEDKKLLSCGRCRLEQYCSQKCQRAHWKHHRITCFGSLEQRVVVVKPHYNSSMKSESNRPKCHGEPLSNLVCNCLFDFLGCDKECITSGTNLILKVITNPFDLGPSSRLGVLDRHRNFTCLIRKEDNPIYYAELLRVVRDMGLPESPGGPGVRVYLLADLRNRNELVFKLGNVLAAQPF